MMFSTIETSIKLFKLPKYNLLKMWIGLNIKEQSLVWLVILMFLSSDSIFVCSICVVFYFW